MAGLVPAIHDFATSGTARRGWPGQALRDAHISETAMKSNACSMAASVSPSSWPGLSGLSVAARAGIGGPAWLGPIPLAGRAHAQLVAGEQAPRACAMIGATSSFNPCCRPDAYSWLQP